MTFDLSQIIRSQTELQILGIYGSAFWFFETVKQLQDAQLHLPVVFTLEINFDQDIYKISLFPAFYSIDRHPTIHQVLAKFFNKDQSYYMFVTFIMFVTLTFFPSHC